MKAYIYRFFDNKTECILAEVLSVKEFRREYFCECFYNNAVGRFKTNEFQLYNEFMQFVTLETFPLTSQRVKNLYNEMREYFLPIVEFKEKQ